MTSMEFTFSSPKDAVLCVGALVVAVPQVHPVVQELADTWGTKPSQNENVKAISFFKLLSQHTVRGE